MSNLWMNWRFGAWHFQIRRDRPWFSFAKNEYHVEHPPAAWFERYTV